FLHGNFHLLSFARALARVQRGENSQRDAHARRFVADAERLGSLGAVVLPRAVRPARDAVVARRGVAVVGVRPPLAVAARAGVDQPRIQTLDRIVVQAETL